MSGVSELALPGSNDITNASVEVEDEFSLDGFITAMMFDDALDLVSHHYYPAMVVSM